jgi:hypothetical protein
MVGDVPARDDRGTLHVLRRSPLALIALLAVVVALVLVLVVSVLSRHNPPPGRLAGPSTGAHGAAAPPSCVGVGRAVVRPLAQGFVTGKQWEEAAPPDNTTFDVTGVTSTAYPSTRSPFALGTGRPAVNACLLGGIVLGRAEDSQPWELYHSDYNAACVKIIARGWGQVRGLRCDNVEDGIRPEESTGNANDAAIYVSGTYLTRIRDDCLENDFTLGGLLQDSLWEECNTGISERPAGGASWTSPPSETLTLDHMLIGLYQTPHEKNGPTTGENALFKWSSSANHLVIKCSLFKVDARSLNGTDSMAVPPGTVVDDSQCRDQPSTIVWLGGGRYPAPTAGMRVVTDRSVWTDAVAAWKAAHGVS